jgi:hypothetical protein
MDVADKNAAQLLCTEVEQTRAKLLELVARSGDQYLAQAVEYLNFAVSNMWHFADPKHWWQAPHALDDAG